MNVIKDIKVAGKHGRPVTLDLHYVDNGVKKPVVIFAHGFKGFKDWGHWGLIANAFAKEGFFFLKFNFSHNGTTPETPSDFSDLEAFGMNNYSKEWADIDVVLEWLNGTDAPSESLDMDNVTLIGHSRGGGLAVVKTHHDARIHKLITWAAVSRLDYAFKPEYLDEWKNSGVFEVYNGRTQQMMPLYFQLVEDFKMNGDKFDVPSAARSFSKPWLIIHGDADPAVPVSSAEELQHQCPTSKLLVIKDANHVFGGKHPYLSEELPLHSVALVSESVMFLKNQNL